MPRRTDTPSRGTALQRLVAFARGEGWELVASAQGFPRLCKPGLPAIHLGMPGEPGDASLTSERSHRERAHETCPDPRGRP